VKENILVLEKDNSPKSLIDEVQNDILVCCCVIHAFNGFSRNPIIRTKKLSRYAICLYHYTASADWLGVVW
jgi:hypothetical protein